jgi:hypothetical protein
MIAGFPGFMCLGEEKKKGKRYAILKKWFRFSS